MEMKKIMSIALLMGMFATTVVGASNEGQAVAAQPQAEISLIAAAQATIDQPEEHCCEATVGCCVDLLKELCTAAVSCCPTSQRKSYQELADLRSYRGSTTSLSSVNSATLARAIEMASRP